MKTIGFSLIVLLALIACSKTDEIVDPAQTALEWRAYSVTTTPATEITSFTATSGGTIGSSGGGNSTSERGICYNTSPNPTTANFKIANGAGAGTYVCVMTGLTGNTLYYVRAYAIKSGVTTYGNQVTFTTYPNPGTVTDYDGNIYQTINIGGQIWMMENLRTTHYQDGTVIPAVPDSVEWFGLTSGGRCSYQNNESFVATYGRLYNWYAATDAHNIAPAGYHVPSLTEWTTLVNYLGGCSVAGGKLKETGTGHWTPTNVASNYANFFALPGGDRWADPLQNKAYFNGLGYRGAWWASSQYADPAYAHYVQMQGSDDDIMGSICAFSGIGNISFNKKTGYSIRCIKN